MISGIEVGKHGGDLRMLIGRERDARFFNTYGYSHLVAYTPELELVPDILESFEVEDGRIFTLHLRKGHKWSDGEPFTAEDIRFFWDDIENNDDLTFSGPDIRLLVDGEK
ncbi:MAG: ABC transporter substrate-binding protein, partial [Geminicoccaceae bacterium]